MLYRVTAIAFTLLSSAALAQQPTPLLPSPSGSRSSASSSIEASPLGPPAGVPAISSPPDSSPPAAPIQPALPVQTESAPPAGRVFCDQNVGYRVVDPALVAEPFRPFVGIFSDAAWNPQLCAALIVENVQGDGTAAITYVFGPMTTGGKTPGGVLHGIGVVKDGALLFQNSDGSQFAFKPFYADLAGRLSTSKGQTYEAVFKRSY